MALPKFMALKSNYNDRYLSYINEDLQMHGFLQSVGEEIASPYAKYEVERAKSVTGLVHIKCCYNNKYWVRMSSNHSWIVAQADEPDEDQSQWSCTLFELVNVQTPSHGDADANAKTVQLRHVQLNHYACLRSIVTSGNHYTSSSSLEYNACLFAGSPEVANNDITEDFTIIDLDSLFVLPKHVLFKGDNDKYLGVRMIENHPYLQFSSVEIQNASVLNEVFTTGNGSVRIKSVHSNKFWRRNADWIWADSDDTTSGNPDMLFWPIKVDNVVFLKNLGNNNFCGRRTAGGKTDCLSATMKTQLKVEEPVKSRKIDNVKFRPMDGRIYSLVSHTMATRYYFNRTSETVPATIDLSYIDVKKFKWNSSVSVKFWNKIALTSNIPTIDEGMIKIPNEEIEKLYNWGETVTEITEVKKSHDVTVPPMTMVVVSLKAKNGWYDVPFSYSQHDTLINNENPDSYSMDDGIYTGTNFFDFDVETVAQKLP